MLSQTFGQKDRFENLLKLADYIESQENFCLCQLEDCKAKQTALKTKYMFDFLDKDQSSELVSEEESYFGMSALQGFFDLSYSELCYLFREDSYKNPSNIEIAKRIRCFVMDKRFEERKECYGD